jgi:hypothetical protein
VLRAPRSYFPSTFLTYWILKKLMFLGPPLSSLALRRPGYLSKEARSFAPPPRGEYALSAPLIVLIGKVYTHLTPYGLDLRQTPGTFVPFSTDARIR